MCVSAHISIASKTTLSVMWRSPWRITMLLSKFAISPFTSLRSTSLHITWDTSISRIGGVRDVCVGAKKGQRIHNKGLHSDMAWRRSLCVHSSVRAIWRRVYEMSHTVIPSSQCEDSHHPFQARDPLLKRGGKGGDTYSMRAQEDNK